MCLSARKWRGRSVTVSLGEHETRLECLVQKLQSDKAAKAVPQFDHDELTFLYKRTHTVFFTHEPAFKKEAKPLIGLSHPVQLSQERLVCDRSLRLLRHLS